MKKLHGSKLSMYHENRSAHIEHVACTASRSETDHRNTLMCAKYHTTSCDQPPEQIIDWEYVRTIRLFIDEATKLLDSRKHGPNSGIRLELRSEGRSCRL